MTSTGKLEQLAKTSEVLGREQTGFGFLQTLSSSAPVLSQQLGRIVDKAADPGAELRAAGNALDEVAKFVLSSRFSDVTQSVIRIVTEYGKALENAAGTGEAARSLEASRDTFLNALDKYLVRHKNSELSELIVAGALLYTEVSRLPTSRR